MFLQLKAKRLNKKARKLAAAGAYKKAINALSQSISIQPDNSNSYWLRGNYWGVLKQYNKAVADHHKVTELDPLSAEAWGTLGWWLILEERWQEALPVSMKAHELNPDSYSWALNIGHIYILFFHNESVARKYYEKALVNINDEAAFKNGPVKDFEFFIKKNWQKELCERYLMWMKNKFN